MAEDISKALDLVPLDNKTTEIAQSIISEDDVDKVKDLTHMFNLMQAKKNVIRVMKMNSLLDSVTEQMTERFAKRPAEFSNADLLSYMNVVQSAIDRANKSITQVDETPVITLQQNNVNVTIEDTFDRASRDRIADAVKAMLKRAEQMAKESDDAIDVKEDIVIENSDVVEETDDVEASSAE